MEILVETMRREGFELTIGSPQIIYKQKNGKMYEPIEHLFIDCDESCIGIITEKLSRRKGRMDKLINHGTGRIRMEFSIPTRSLIGYRNEFMTDTRGSGIINSYLKGYEEYRGDFSSRLTGSLVADRQGTAVAYALHNLEPRGTLFIAPGTPVYEGMVIGETSREMDINVNPCKEKKLTNMRSSNADENIILTPAREMTLGKAITFIRDDEMVEITPLSVRIRKTQLPAHNRKRIRAEKLKE